LKPPKLSYIKTPKNSQNTLFHTSKFSNPQITLFQTPRKPYFSLQKFPKTPYFRSPKKTCKHHVSNLENPYFRPAKHHVLGPKIIFQAPKKSYFKAEMKPCFKP
jgi:hypothetical protein